MSNPLNTLCAGQIAQMIRDGETTAAAVMAACLEHITQRESDVGAFIHLDAERAMERAKAADKSPSDGLLHGVPFGIKDIIDTADYPTGWGSQIYHEHRPPRNASCVEHFVRAGAIPVGKTVSTEFAYFQPGKTANPHNLGHTPGGSSSGSAAAVGDNMLPLAFGSQTAGSVVRPAAFCGVLGYKPTIGDFDLQGVMGLAPNLDTLGVMAREVEDIALARSVLCGTDPGLQGDFADRPPRIGFFLGPHWADGSNDMRANCLKALDLLKSCGAESIELRSLQSFEDLSDHQNTVMAYETSRARIFEYSQHRTQISDHFVELTERGLATPRQEYLSALGARDVAAREFQACFDDVDVVLTPASPGEAPEGLHATGDPMFNRAWTLLGVPCMAVPFGKTSRGLPLSIQLVGASGDDDRLLAAAKWVHRCLSKS